MKLLALSLLTILLASFSSCKEYSLDQETIDLIDSATARHYSHFDEFDSNLGWLAEDYNLGQIEAGHYIDLGVLSLNAYQGEDCDRQSVEFGFELDGELATLFAEEEDIHIEIEINRAVTSALGSNSFSYSYGYTTTRIYFEQIEDVTCFELILDKGEIKEAYSNGEVVINYWISSFNSSIPSSKFEFESDACGPDLYAGAEMEIDRFSIFRTRD